MRFLHPVSLRLTPLILTLLALAVCQVTRAQGVSFHYTPINVPFSDPLFGYSTIATGINNRGQIVGSYIGDLQPDGTAPLRGFLRDHDVYTVFDVVGTSLPPGTQPRGINDQGQIVGWYQDNDMVWGTVLRGFLYDHGVVTRLNPPDASGLEVRALGINNRGQIVGFYFDINWVLHGFVYDHGHYTVRDFPGSQDTRPFGINDRGQIVGICYDINSVAHYFLYDHDHFTVLEVPAAAYFDSSNNSVAINDRGQVVGSYFDINFFAHGFLYDHGHFTQFDAPNAAKNPNGYSGTFATGINARGEIVGYAYGKTGPPGFVLRILGGDH